MTPAGLSNNHGTRHELSMPSTIIAVETLPHLRRAEFEGRPLPGAASAGVESQTGVLRPSVAESRGHAWTPGGGPRVGEQLGGGRRHGYAQAHGRESAAGVDFIAPQTPVSWAAPVGVAHASTSAAPADHLQGGAWAARRASPPRRRAPPSERLATERERHFVDVAAGGGAAQRAGCGRRRCDAYPWAAATPSSHPDFAPAGGTEVWSSLQTLERDGSPGGKIGYQPTILK